MYARSLISLASLNTLAIQGRASASYFKTLLRSMPMV